MSIVLEFFLWLVFALFAVYFWSSLAAKEIAHKSGKQHCSDLGVQFLDDSVELMRIKLYRNHNGRIAWLRVYGFEFTLAGERRYKGKITLQGKMVIGVEAESHPQE